MHRLLLLLPLVCLVACEDAGLYRNPDPPDTGVEVDAGSIPPPMDAGVIDMGVVEPPPAAEPVYIHTGTTLFSWDPDSNQATRIGDFRTAGGPLEADMADIAIDLQGRMFGGTVGTPAGPNEIYQIDPETGVCTYRFDFNDILHGLTFLPDGKLVVAGKRISVVDPSNGDMIRELPGTNTYETSGDIVGLPDGYLYWTVRGVRPAMGPTGPDRVVRIDPRSGALLELGEAQVDRIYGLGYAEDELFGFSSGGVVVTLDPDSGSVTRQQPLTGRWFGATTNPVLW